MASVARGDRRFARSGNTGDLHVADLDRPADLPLRGSDPGCRFGCCSVERQHAAAEDFVDGDIKLILESVAPAGLAPEAQGRNGFRKL